eukprot:7401900-Alexandrium_andersonii.AAC.2
MRTHEGCAHAHGRAPHEPMITHAHLTQSSMHRCLLRTRANVLSYAAPACHLHVYATARARERTHPREPHTHAGTHAHAIATEEGYHRCTYGNLSWNAT